MEQAQFSQATTLVLLDRNVVSLIKRVVDGGSPRDKTECAALEKLKSLDRPEMRFSPLLSSIEGEKGREDSVEEKAVCVEKEAVALGRFFKNAGTDSSYLGERRDLAAEVFAGSIESLWTERTDFLLKAASLIAQKVGQLERRAVEEKLITFARASKLAADDALTVLCIACLYGSEDARKVLKPHKPNAYNVLSDLHVISRVGMVKAVVDTLTLQVKVRFETLDLGLRGVLSKVRIVSSELRPDGSVQICIRYLPALFPELPEAGVVDLLNRLTA